MASKPQADRVRDFLLAFSVVSLSGCATQAPVPHRPSSPPPAAAVLDTTWRESPVADGIWRPHLLSRCRQLKDEAPPAVERSLADAFELFRYQAGSDAIMELELCLRVHSDQGLLLLTLGQLYLLGGQGEPWLLPREGPAADVGNWSGNRARLLRRAQALLERAGSSRPDDCVVDYLLGDVHRAAGDTAAAAAAVAAGMTKCALPRSLDILRRYQKLGGHGAQLLASAAPTYPPAAVAEGVVGEVVLDLLLDPAGTVKQVVTVASPDARLTSAAAEALRNSRFQPARLGKYPLWSWIRIPTTFQLEG